MILEPDSSAGAMKNPRSSHVIMHSSYAVVFQSAKTLGCSQEGCLVSEIRLFCRMIGTRDMRDSIVIRIF